jgi:hypothetical protein
VSPSSPSPSFRRRWFPRQPSLCRWSPRRPWPFRARLVPREASPARRPTPARPAAPVEQVAAALPTAAAPAAGTVIVTTPGGWANVFDRAGRLLGQTPLRAQIPAGTHTLSLRPFGQPPAITVSVEVMAGGTARVSRPLEE